MTKMPNGLATSFLILINSLTWSSTWALAGDSQFKTPLNSFSAAAGQNIEKLRQAYQSIQAEPSLREIIKEDKVHSLTLQQRVEGAGIETTKFQHYFKGIEVVGSMAIHHSGPAGTQVRDSIVRFNLDPRPTVSTDAAVGIAKSYAGDRQLFEAPTLKVLPRTGGASADLIYWVRLKPTLSKPGRDLIINAHNGQVLANLSHQITLAPIQVFSGKVNAVGIDPEQMPEDPSMLDPADLAKLKKACQIVNVRDGSPLAINLVNCKQIVTDSKIEAGAEGMAVRANDNSKAVLEYYKNRFDRNSFDNRGAELVSVIHIGKDFDNAFWNSEDNMMAYGDGDGKIYRDFTYSLNVAGHEMTHGVVSKTADLQPMKEQGALNEALADFFGLMVENKNNWVVGNDLMVTPSPGEGIRNLQAPAQLTTVIPSDIPGGRPKRVGYPDHMSKKLPESPTCDENNDYCWIHINSTIAGHTFYKLVQAIGKEKTELLNYTVLTQYLRSTSGFQDLARDSQDACKNLFDAATCATVQSTYASMGFSSAGFQSVF